jgi:hypothetical protein
MAEGSVLDVAGFVGSFANDGVINLGYTGMEPTGVGKESFFRSDNRRFRMIAKHRHAK